MEKTKIDATTGKITVTFTDDDGEVFSTFRISPTDSGVAKRCEDVSIYFESNKDRILNTLDEIVQYNQEIEEKICYILGYDAKKSVFGELSATTVLPDGDIFALVILEKIASIVKPEIEKRKQKMSAAVNKYMKKYQ